LQNYPNPLRAGFAVTRINYELPAASSVKIAVYNLNGQLMRSLVEGRQSAGRYAVSWDGQTLSGKPVASGIYLIRMEADKFVATRKIVVAR
jgi:flagellar hook assembly protein FlgD